MTGLRRAADMLRRAGGHVGLSHERLFEVQRAAADLAGRRRETGARTEPIRALRQHLATVLALQPGVAAATIAKALAAERRSVDRAIIRAYLDALPCDHADFEALRAAAEAAADRHDWRWRELGLTHALWRPVRSAAGLWHLADDTLPALRRSAAT